MVANIVMTARSATLAGATGTQGMRSVGSSRDDARGLHVMCASMVRDGRWLLLMLRRRLVLGQF